MSYIEDIKIPLRYNLVETGRVVKLGDMKHHVFMFQLQSKGSNIYKAFCSGNIISENRVISSSHCFLTNRKKYIRALNEIRVVAGVLTVTVKRDVEDEKQQWRNITRVFSQRYFRFPAYNLAVLVINKPWSFNTVVNKIPYASLDKDYDGICSATAIRTTTAWASSKTLFTETMQVIKRRTCEIMVQRTARQFLCTNYDKTSALSTAETEGGGLICRGTGDPEEDETDGILVGITALVNIHLPSLHTRIGLFNKWVKDISNRLDVSYLTLFTSCAIWFLQ